MAALICLPDVSRNAIVHPIELIHPHEERAPLHINTGSFKRGVDP
jgi:hypothetical protein